MVTKKDRLNHTAGPHEMEEENKHPKSRLGEIRQNARGSFPLFL